MENVWLWEGGWSWRSSLGWGGKNSHASHRTGHLNSAMLRLSVQEIRGANNF